MIMHDTKMFVFTHRCGSEVSSRFSVVLSGKPDSPGRGVAEVGRGGGGVDEPAAASAGGRFLVTKRGVALRRGRSHRVAR